MVALRSCDIIGIGSTLLAVLLLRLIALSTNGFLLSPFQLNISPADSSLRPWTVIVPVMLDICNQPYSETIAASREVASQMYRLRLSAKP